MDIGTLYRGIESARGLDGPSTGLRRRILEITERSDRSRTVAALLRGAAVGHPLHPALVAVPAGAWTASLIFDTVLRDPKTARRLIGLGLISTPPVLLTGWLDWSERGDVARRVGLVHAASNAVGIWSFAASYRLRGKDSLALARVFSVLGLAAVGVGGALGGHIVFKLMDDPAVEAAATPVLDPILDVVN
ncbi:MULTISPECIES: DUF2231 domain-containing protein [unclassified Rhodococcus (in: high G+C Gram-positive bacteria)]|jgi:uncharacterized membrane protein|uniref:DUF2231 domain-containing protein n=1 Tax=unclassified Rhodococcus (in: high G+C Gram-positive bacteria) TaxID=192944 RepID=UPI000F5AF02F|nr:MULTISPECIES: DUF2231 domain-containing protein [unclassified Rhodococcus (in: high G+C Gram-positive bacteria)]NHP15052.1 hypothetical protein [Rhodococcus sp. IC4_135]QQM23052.1 hypothetical protein I7X09_05940 [Rhodococcus sp. P-2]RQO47407.1 hypothetical protein DBV08_15105 [Rhodococcus sp. KBW08]